jgi:hypothetical protein
VEEGWLNIDEALVLVVAIMNQNARDIFNIDKKQEILKTVPWKLRELAIDSETKTDPQIE